MVVRSLSFFPLFFCLFKFLCSLNLFIIQARHQKKRLFCEIFKPTTNFYHTIKPTTEPKRYRTIYYQSKLRMMRNVSSICAWCMVVRPFSDVFLIHQPFVALRHISCGIRTLQPLVLLVGLVSHQQFQAIYTGVLSSVLVCDTDSASPDTKRWKLELPADRNYIIYRPSFENSFLWHYSKDVELWLIGNRFYIHPAILY